MRDNMKCNRLWEYMKCMLLQYVRDSISTFLDAPPSPCLVLEADLVLEAAWGAEAFLRGGRLSLTLPPYCCFRVGAACSLASCSRNSLT